MSWDETNPGSPAATLDAPEPFGELGLFHANLSRFCGAEMPMSRALHCLREELTGGLRDDCAAMADEIDRGVPFADAYARRAERFPPVYRALVDAGLQAGDLPGVLREISIDASLRERVRDRLKQRLEYPLIVTLIVFVLGVVLVLLVAPAYQMPLSQTGELPNPSPWLALAAGAMLALAALGVVVFALLRKPFESGAGPRGWWYRLPLVGRLHGLAAKAGFASTLALLMRRQIPLPRALELCAVSNDGAEVREQIRRMAAAAEAGAGLGDSVRAGDLIPPSLLWFVEAAGSDGDDASALDDIAGVYRQRLHRATERVSTFAVPILELLIGFIVLGFALTYIVPAYEMYDAVFDPIRFGR